MNLCNEILTNIRAEFSPYDVLSPMSINYTDSFLIIIPKTRREAPISPAGEGDCGKGIKKSGPKPLPFPLENSI